jgi:hypothetical protein
MLVGSLLVWWYGAGLKSRAGSLANGLARTVDYFSVGLLIKTLFSPFRQISAAKATGAPMGIKVRMLFDRLVSRFVGACVRIITMVVGLIVIILQLVFSLVVVVLHIAAPLLPVGGIIMMLIGWVPTWPF